MSFYLVSIFFYTSSFTVSIILSIFQMKRSLNLNNTEEVKPYIDLWKIGHLVSENRHFPVFEKKEERFTPGREVFVRQVNNLANNFKVKLIICLIS